LLVGAGLSNDGVNLVWREHKGSDLVALVNNGSIAVQGLNKETGDWLAAGTIADARVDNKLYQL
jgi:hypothetical protein